MTDTAFLLPLISLLVCFRARAIGNWLGVIDYPGQILKTHDTPTPLVGGIAVTLPLIIYCIVYLWLHSNSLIHAALIIAVGGAFLLGFFDDRRSLSPFLRLLCGATLVFVNLTILSALVVGQFDFSFLTEPIVMQPFSIAFSVLVIVGLMNAINMADGTNGLVCGLCLIWSVLLSFYAPPEIAPLSAILAICLFVTLIFNLAGKLFLGDSGTYAAGLAISLLTIYTYNSTGGSLNADTVVAWFIVPVIDCLRLIVVRTSQRRSPSSPDNNHLHHRLQRIMPWWGAVLSYWMLVAIPGAMAIAQPSLAWITVLAVASIYLGLLALTSEWFAVGKSKIQVSNSLE